MDQYAGIAQVYDVWSAHKTEDVPFYVDLAREADGPVVELAVGSGGRSSAWRRRFVPAAASRGTHSCSTTRSPRGSTDSHEEEPVPHVVHHAVGDSRIDLTLDSGSSVSIWWATKNEWLGLIDVAGLETEALYGWFDRRPFDDESREFVWVARKRG